MNVHAYAVGICSLSACCPADLPIAEVEREINERHPTGIQSSWQVSTDPHFAGPSIFGEPTPNPCPCEQTPGRVHRLLHC